MRLERQLVALLGLLADREQAHLGVRHLEDLLRKDRAHVPELDEVLRAIVGVRSRVDEDRGAESRRDDDGDRRTQDAREPANVEQPGGEHRARVPGRDDRVGFAGADGSTRCDEARVRLRPHGVRGLLVHRDLLGRRDELEAVGVERRRAEENDVDALARGLERPGDHLDRAAVAAKGIHGYAGHYGAGAVSGSTSRPLYVLQFGQT